MMKMAASDAVGLGGELLSAAMVNSPPASATLPIALLLDFNVIHGQDWQALSAVIMVLTALAHIAVK
jgi:hypothetical protein